MPATDPPTGVLDASAGQPTAGLEAYRLAVVLASRQERFGWRGVDPYDGLASPLARLLVGRCPRQALVQAVRRSPVNLRPLLGIGPRRMAATTGLAATAANRLAADPVWADLRDRLGSWTARRQLTQGPWQGLWGYEVDVQTRWGAYPAGSPNAIATIVAANGCLDAGSLGAPGQAMLGAALLRCLWRGTHFAYTPASSVLIHNANVLVAATAARLASGGMLEVPLGERLRRVASTAVATTLAGQRSDGSWPYGEERRLNWVDGYHTAYTLLALDDATKLLEERDAGAALELGARFYFEHLFDGPIPRFLAGPKPGRSDINNVATGLRAAVWGATNRYAPPDLPVRVLKVLRAGFWDPRRQCVRASAARHRPAARLDYPRWGAAPTLDALTALIHWNREGGPS